MCPVIRVPQNVYSRLEKHAEGFDTPANVIERILDSYEGVESKPAEKPSSVEIQSSGRDTTKYLFEGQLYGKGRLVLAVVQAHVAENPDISFSDLLSEFPKQLQGSIGVFSEADEAKEISQRTGHKRHFIKPNELIQLSDGVIAVCTEWGAGNIHRFIGQANSLGYAITPKKG